MKALIVITGRGLGGDSVIAYNIIEGLEAKGVQCEIALDESAPGLLFKKKGRTWHKIKIPQAGGHAATKASSVKAAFKMLTATFKARSLIKKLDVDIVVGVIGGGAIVGSVGAKLAGKPGVSIISTPLDSKICPKLNQCYALPEMKYFLPEHLPKNINHTLYPLSEGVGNGNPDIALEKLKESPKFDENKKTILFSSGSSIYSIFILQSVVISNAVSLSELNAYVLNSAEVISSRLLVYTVTILDGIRFSVKNSVILTFSI